VFCIINADIISIIPPLLEGKTRARNVHLLCLTKISWSAGKWTKMTVPGLNFDLMDQLTFYGSYHTRGWNQCIHFVFVPLIHWTITVWLAYAPLPTSFDLPAHLDFLPPSIAR
jgi:hypothetical protein